MHDPVDQFQDAAPAITLREYGDILRRRRYTILQIFVIVMVAGVLVTIFSPPTYRATARILVDPPSQVITMQEASNPLSSILTPQQQYSVQTQVELLQKTGLLRQVAQKIGGDLPFMSVEAVKDTQIIEVEAEGDDPEKVAGAPNLLLETYIESTKADNGVNVKQSLQFVEENARRAENELRGLENRLEQFKRRNKVAEVNQNRDAELSTVMSLTNQYQSAQTQLGAIRAQRAALKSQIARTPEFKSFVASATADPAVQALETQIATLEAQRAGLLVDYTELNPRVVAVDAQLASLRGRLAQQRIGTSLRNQQPNPRFNALNDKLIDFDIQAQGVSIQAADTSRQLREAQTRLASFPSYETEYNRLLRRLADAKGRYETFISKRADLQLRDKAQPVTAHIVEKAQVPTSPIRPRKLQNILFSVLLGSFLGLCLALLQEFLDDRINSVDEADRVLRLPNLGHVPAIEEEGLRLIRDLKTYSPITEAYRSLRTNLSFASVDHPVHTLMITSSGPGEGKSTTVANLAMAMAMDGKKVVVVDADLRRPTQHKLFRLQPSPGLTDILIGTHAIDDVVRTTNVENVSVIPAGSVPPNPAELLGSEAMAHFVEALRASADVILFDSPPALAVADSILLASRVDGVLFVVGFGETKKTNARQALELLSRARAHVLGTVLNKIDSAASGYYYGQYYYTPIEGGERGSSAANGVLGEGAANNNGGNNGTNGHNTPEALPLNIAPGDVEGTPPPASPPAEAETGATAPPAVTAAATRSRASRARANFPWQPPSRPGADAVLPGGSEQRIEARPPHPTASAADNAADSDREGNA